MNQSTRKARPPGFKTMAILGYIAEGISVVWSAASCFSLASQGYIFGAGFSFLSLGLSVVAIVLIFLMAEKKKVCALRAIQVYLWLTIPYSMFVALVDAFETSNELELIGIPMALLIGLPIAIYWQQKSHSEYLKSLSL